MNGPVVRLLMFMLAVGVTIGVLISSFIKASLPIKHPLVAENVRSKFMPNGNWRVTEDLVLHEPCEVLIFERRFKDFALGRWVPAAPVDSWPSDQGSAIGRAYLKVGENVGWAEYDPSRGWLQRGIYTVVVTADRCPSGFSGSYALIALVEYDFTKRRTP